ncbi:MAG TPA: hypothetical protein VNN73_17425 [Blastocatellia bacterium]|nr:hypothetical protein [Blastocatellia bacterium]
MAGKQKYTPDQVIEAIRKTKGLVTLAAKSLGCDPDTIRNYARRYKSVSAAIREQRESVTDIAEASLFTAIQQGCAWAVCFYLKTQGRERGYVERRELTGAEGAPIPIAIIEVRGPDGRSKKEEP